MPVFNETIPEPTPIFAPNPDFAPTPDPSLGREGMTPFRTAENPRPLVPQAWQSMNTAPMDGTTIIASGFYSPKEANLPMSAMAVRFKDGIWWRDNQGHGMTVECFPMRWIPIPD